MCIAFLATITPLVRAQSALEVGDIAGCYDVEISGLDPVGADSVYYRPPPRVVLDVDRREQGLGAESRVITVPPGSIPSPHATAYWGIQDSTVRMTWTTGYIGISANVNVVPGGLSGEYNRFTDVVRRTPRPRGTFTATRVDCTEPTPFRVSEMARYFRPIPVRGGESLELGEAIPPSLAVTPTRRPRTYTLGADVEGALRGADGIRVRVDEAGRMTSIHLSYPLEDLERIREWLVNTFGRWHAHEESSESQHWYWQGRAESLSLGAYAGRAVTVRFACRGVLCGG